MITEETKDYYKENAEAWMNNAYLSDGYNYSTPLNRIRILKKILKTKSNINCVLDIGCGGGLVSIELAKLGYNVIAVDQSEEMLQIAENNIRIQSKDVKDRINLSLCSVHDLSDKFSNIKFDCAIAMGIIGYLNSDEDFFKCVKPLLHNNADLIVSFRNRLFNLFSISFRTLNEVSNNNIENLIKEFSYHCHSISKDKAYAFIKALNEITSNIIANDFLNYNSNNSNVIKYTRDIEPRQSTPLEVKNISKRNEFDICSIYGVHPHLLIPGLNKNLPPTIYNKLCDSLIPLENEDIALLWSSSFICNFINKSSSEA